jgi:sulfate transport system substrate-binding protein
MCFLRVLIAWRQMAAVSLLTVVPLLAGCSQTANSAADAGGNAPKEQELLNVSYDPTRELWRALNDKFIPRYEKESGTKLTIKQSHAGSSSQARSVIDGLEADVVTLAMWGDTNAIAKAGLIKEGWPDRLPNGSLPYSSTIVFVVRQGNPKAIKDWPDLIKDGVEVITPNPKTSGNGKLSFLAGWGSVILRNGSEEEAEAFITKLYQHTPVLDSAARAATVTFAEKNIGDVHLTWENEAHLEVKEHPGELEIVYPPLSIRAEPRVAVVDANVDRKGTRAAAEAYLQFLYSDEAQEVMASNFFRPSDPLILKSHSESFAPIQLFTIKDIARDWDDADARFFATGGMFDRLYSPPTN